MLTPLSGGLRNFFLIPHTSKYAMCAQIANRTANIAALFSSLLIAVIVAVDWGSETKPQTLRDGALYGYIGQRIAEGRVPYRHLFDVKPPLAQYIPAATAWLTRSSTSQYILLQSITAICVVATVWFLTDVLERSLDNGQAAAITAVTLLALPIVTLVVARGYRPKAPVIALGMASIWLVDRRPLAAAVISAGCAAIWQFGIVFPALVVGRVVSCRGTASGIRAIGGIIAVGAISVVPVALGGGLNQMIVQVVLSPFLASESQSVSDRVVRGGQIAWPLAPIVLMSIPGALLSSQHSGTWWVLPLGGAGAAQTLLFDLDGPPDLLLGYLAVAGAVGVLYHHTVSERRRHIVMALIIVSGSMMAGLAVTDDAFLGKSADSENQSKLEEAFWSGESLDRCYLGKSSMERKFVDAVEGDFSQHTCGPYPITELVIREKE